MILALTSETRTTSEIYDIASTVLAQKVAQVTGVGDVTVGGGSLPAVRVELEPYALSQYGIALDEVRRAIAGANVLRPKGLVEDGERSWQIQASDQLTKASDYESLIITYRNGAPVRLSDVAKVYDGVEDRFNTGFYNRKPAVLLIVSRQPDANIIETVDAIHEQMPALRAFLPAGVDLNIASDRSPSIRATLHEAERSLLIAVGARHPRRAAVPGELPRRAHPRGGRAGRADRQLCRDVPLGVLAQQPLADGADRRHRAGRRRCHRRAGEHLAARGEGAAAPRGGARRRARSRLHAAVDEPRARRRLRLDSLHGRDRRAAVPRVLDHARRGDPDFAGRVADADADALRALAAGAAAAEPVAARERGGVRLAGARLRPDARAGRCSTRRW